MASAAFTAHQSGTSDGDKMHNRGQKAQPASKSLPKAVSAQTSAFTNMVPCDISQAHRFLTQLRSSPRLAHKNEYSDIERLMTRS